jgi:NADP-dependent 3-hydroxy acid dehydrogenase YdfG
MTQTILITGASSGIGKATAQLFHDNGWNVIATMRTPENDTELSALKNVLVTRLDVTDSATIASAMQAGIDKFGKIDVLLNNAGYGAYGPLEAFPMERIRRQFDTNVIGLIETTKGVLPHMRANGAGTIVNISSIGGQMTFPLGALYHGTKFAVEGISEAMHYELEAAGIRTKIVEPGMIATDFGGRSFDFVNDEEMTEYQPVVQALFSRWGSPGAGANASPASLVAEVIWTAVTDGTNTLRYRAGADAVELLDNRKAADDATFIGGMKAQLGLT